MNRISLPAGILQLIRKLNEAGYEAYAVGGCVRDALLMRLTHDYDLTTNALPEEIHGVFKDAHIIDTGIQHGTVTVIADHIPVEITTYRTESAYNDHRHPDHVSFTRSLKEDCARRDFTINAMAYHPDAGIVDHFNGMNDLQAKIIRSVNDPEERFNEDALRILRAVRFAAQLGFTIEEKTAEAVLKHREDLKYISMERTEAELQKLLMSESPASVLDPYRSLMEVILPQLRKDAAWDDTLKCMDRSERRYAVRLAVLTRNVPFTKDDLNGLKVSGEVRDCVLALRRYKDLPFCTVPDLRKAMYRTGKYYDDYLAFRTATDCWACAEELRGMSQTIRDRGDCVSLAQLAVNGNDLMDCGIQGRQISLKLEELLYAVMEERCSNNRESLLEYLKTVE